jgi:uncharacterized membrane protein (UPF0127 family)
LFNTNLQGKQKKKFIRLNINSSNFIVELALEPSEWERGLMFRKSIPDDYGMLFVFTEEDYQWFWMKNTYIPLDIIWINRDKKIVYIAENCKPCIKEPCSSYGTEIPVLYVLELKAGSVKKHNIKTGETVDFFIPQEFLLSGVSINTSGTSSFSASICSSSY